MKKIFYSLVIAIMLSSSVMVSASVKMATLINASGKKIVVSVGSPIPFGFKLFVEKKLGQYIPQQLFQQTNLVGTAAAPWNFIASTTNLSLIATSTSVVDGDYGFDTLSLNIKVVNSSSTGANTLTITPTYSNDSGCQNYLDTSINWFSSTNGGNQAATTSVFAAGATTMKKYDITNLATVCTKLVITPSHSSSTIWVQSLLK